MSEKIERREDVNPKEGQREDGDVEFADQVNHKYPINSAEHVRAAWSYINHPDNAKKYPRDDVELIKSRIKIAAEKYGVEISSD